LPFKCNLHRYNAALKALMKASQAGRCALTPPDPQLKRA
jgi:hypothetical protein